MSVELKIKSKSLAAESRIIRDEEIKLRNATRKRASLQKPVSTLNHQRKSLYEHRIDVVRTEARATFLARAYLSGKPRSAVEAKPVHAARRAENIARKYSSTPFDVDKFRAWLSA